MSLLTATTTASCASLISSISVPLTPLKASLTLHWQMNKLTLMLSLSWGVWNKTISRQLNTTQLHCVVVLSGLSMYQENTTMTFRRSSALAMRRDGSIFLNFSSLHDVKTCWDSMFLMIHHFHTLWPVSNLELLIAYVLTI